MTRARLGRGIRAVALTTLLPFQHTGAQRAPSTPAVPRFRPSIRADAILDRDPGAQLAVGVAVAGAYNVRIGLDAGAGGVRRAGGWVSAGRLELLARILTDPFRTTRWALSAGGGIGQHFECKATPRTVAIVTIGVDGPSDGGWVPGVEIGLGGGVRAGVAFRRAPRGQR